ncbi:MAG: hypothetical protein JST00_08085 [Deltaproteobacteria bacterium]|nr:hypothetical protein [Deltaproteobacteria bacterium]
MTRLALARLVRVIVLVAVLPFVSAGALPAWAELAGVEHPHVCHCARDHHGCVCAKCHTDPDAEMGISSDSVKGRCGDDDVVGGAHGTPPALFVSFVTLLAPSASGRAPVATPPAALSRERLPPPPPPPRMLA